VLCRVGLLECEKDLAEVCEMGVDVDIGLLSSCTRVPPDPNIVHDIWRVLLIAGKLVSMLKLAINLVNKIILIEK